MIPVCEPLLGRKERSYVLDCLKTNWISSSGKYIKAFEEKFSRYCGCHHGVTTTNGTTALHLAFASAGIGSGDEVLMPAFNIASTAFAAIYCGAKPVFIDSQPDTGNIDPRLLEAKITRRTKAIVPVHMYGHPCDMAEIIAVARRHKLMVIEDAAESHGAVYEGKTVGGIGDIGCFSFYGNKIITCGEGGMMVTNSARVARRARRLKNLSFQEKKRYWHEEIGFNYRMTNIQAALGLAQLENIDDLVKRRRRNARIYESLLRDVPGITLPVEKQGVTNVYWMYGILIGRGFGMGREVLMRKLKEAGIETRTFFVPMHRQPVLKKLRITGAGDRYPVADDWGRRGLYLPSGGGLSRDDIERVCATIRSLARGK